MNEARIYQDSKELPLWNYKRILQTEDFFYMVKGYDPGDTIEYNIEELKKKFHEIEKDLSFAINSKNHDIISFGRLEKAKTEVTTLTLLYNIIVLIQKKSGDNMEEVDKVRLSNLLDGVKISKSANISEQLKFILEKIAKWENEVKDLESRLNVEENNINDAFDIDEQIINVKIGLEIEFDERKTSLYQYHLYIQSLIKKVEAINKVNNNHGR